MATRGVNSSGVKQLLDAEKRAAERVEEARRKKIQTMKRAKAEAEQDIAKFREEKEAEFRNRAQTDAGSSNDDSAAINKDLEEKLATLKTSVKKNEKEVIDTLINIVCDIKLQVHENFVKPQA